MTQESRKGWQKRGGFSDLFYIESEGGEEREDWLGSFDDLVNATSQEPVRAPGDNYLGPDWPYVTDEGGKNILVKGYNVGSRAVPLKKSVDGTIATL